MVVPVVREFTGGRTKEIEVYGLHCKGAAGRTARDRWSAMKWWGGVQVQGGMREVWE